MKYKKLSMMLAGLGALSITTSAVAWESADGQHSTSATVWLTSDYVWRGYSQTDEDAAIQGSFDYAHASGFYAGVWGSNVGFAKDADIEIDVYAGFGGNITEDLSYDIGWLRYMYPGTDSKAKSGSGDLDWNEFYGYLGYSYFTVGVAYSSDFANSSETAIYYSAAFDYELPQGFALSAGIGYYDFDKKIYGAKEDSVVDYRLGVSTELAGFTFDVTYTDTNNDGEKLYGKDIAEGRTVFTISKSM